MATPLESDIEGPAHDFARSRGWFAEKIRCAGRRGFPDHYFVRNGRTILIEFKRPGKYPRVQQEKRIAELRAHGAEVFVVDTLDQAVRILT